MRGAASAASSGTAEALRRRGRQRRCVVGDGERRCVVGAGERWREGSGAVWPPTAATGAAIPPGATPANPNLAGANFDPNDAANPFFLHPKENPSLILVSTVLNGRNYHPWARAMEMALLSKNKLGFVDGTIPVPNVGEVKYPYWKRCNNMVSTWITRSVSTEIAQTILWAGTAERIWNTLKARFSEADIFRISDLHAEIHQVRQGDLTVSAYFAKLKGLWDELQVIRPLPTLFLRGLNETYDSVRSQVMMTKPLPTVDEAFLLVQQQERRFNNGTFNPDEQSSKENTGSVCLSQDEYRLLKQFLQRDNLAHNHSPLNEGGEITPQVNLIAANFAPNSQLEGLPNDLILPNDNNIMEDVMVQRNLQRVETMGDDGAAEPDNLRHNLAQNYSDPEQPNLPQSDEVPVQPRRSSRQTSRPAYLRDYDCTLPAARTSPHTLSAVLSYQKQQLEQKLQYNYCIF
nr:uncharacterized protein LOC109159384 [Ipomoea batatas]